MIVTIARPSLNASTDMDAEPSVDVPLITMASLVTFGAGAGVPVTEEPSPEMVAGTAAAAVAGSAARRTWLWILLSPDLYICLTSVGPPSEWSSGASAVNGPAGVGGMLSGFISSAKESDAAAAGV